MRSLIITEYKYLLLLFLITQAVYLLTLAPDIYIGDSTEFISSTYFLGIAHPPGFPLYTMLGRIFHFVSPGFISAVSINYLSALLGSFSICLLYLNQRLLNVDKVITIIISFFFAFTQVFWSRALVSEIYTFIIFSVLLAILLLLLYLRTRNTSYLFLLFYVAGLLLSHHLTSALFFVCIFLFLLFDKPKLLLNWKVILASIVLFFTGFSIYYFIVARSLSDPPGYFPLSSTLSELIHYLLPTSGKLVLAQERGIVSLRLQDNLSWFFNYFFLQQFLVVGLFSFLAFFNRKVNVKIKLLLILIFLLLTYFAANSPLRLYNDLDAQFLISLLILVIMTGLGIDYFLEWIATLSINSTFKSILRISMVTLISLLLLFNTTFNFAVVDRSSDDFAHVFWNDKFSSLPDNAIVFTVSDETAFMPVYFQKIFHKQNDIDFISLHAFKNSQLCRKIYNNLRLEYRQFSTNDEYVLDILSQFRNKRPLFLSLSTARFKVTHEIPKEPFGLIWRINDTLNVAESSKLHLKLLNMVDKVIWDSREKELINDHYIVPLIDHAYLFFEEQKYHSCIERIDILEKLKMDVPQLTYSDALYIRGQAKFKQGNYEQAVVDFRKAIQTYDKDWRSMEFLGYSYLHLGDTTMAVEQWEKAFILNNSRTHLKNAIQKHTH